MSENQTETSPNDPSGIMTGLGNAIGRAIKDSIQNKKANVEWNKPERPNYVFVIKGKIALKAPDDKYIILLDKFRTGFECKTCDGNGILSSCTKCNGTGSNRFGENCSTCNGNPESFIDKDCPDCRGNGSTIIIPDSAKTLPTTGIIVSVGPECTKGRQIGDRVLFGAHTGYMLPLKGNIRLRLMREFEPIADVYMLEGATDKTLGDFTQYEEPIDNS